MAFRHDVHLVCSTGDRVDQDEVDLSLLHGTISEVSMDLWRFEIHIGFHEHDDEESFVRSLAELIRKAGNGIKVVKADWDGLEHYVDSPQEFADVFPIGKKGLKSGKIKDSHLVCRCMRFEGKSTP